MHLCLALCFAVATAVPVRPAEPCTAESLVRIAVVIPDGAEEGFGLPARLGARLAAVLHATGVAAANVRTDRVDAREAAARLQARRCEAVIVLGGYRPSALRRIETTAFAANLGRDYGYRPAYLIVATSGTTRDTSLVTAFPRALQMLTRTVAGD